MAQPTNLTDRITHLRERKGRYSADPTPRKPPPAKQYERKFAPDYFAVFTYTLCTAAFATQLYLIVWLDLF
ncbi:MAG: hypothetical protein ACLFUF_02730 [Opitutales bacterium]